MGQAIAVVERPSGAAGVLAFETNRVLTGMGHERYQAAPEASRTRPPDELARRLFATGQVAGVHVYGNMVTVDLARGSDGHGLAQVIEGLYRFYPDTPA